MKYVSIAYKFSEKPTAHKIEHPLVELLESLHTRGSIGAAAKHLGRSYRHVWGELKFWEKQFDAHLVVWGNKGKAAVLTPEAVQYLKAISQSQKALEVQILQIKKQVLKNTKIIHKTNSLKQTTQWSECQ
jgi:putative molybdopterin biosynthesis protein